MDPIIGNELVTTFAILSHSKLTQLHLQSGKYISSSEWWPYVGSSSMLAKSYLGINNGIIRAYTDCPFRCVIEKINDKVKPFAMNGECVNVKWLTSKKVRAAGCAAGTFCFEMPSLSMSSRLTFVFDRIFEIMPDFVRSDFAICHLEKEVDVKSTALTIATSKAANRDNCSLFCIAILDFLTQCSRQAPSKQAACFL